MITDAELLELELLLIEMYHQHKFGKIYHNEITNEIIVLRKDVEVLLSLHYSDRCKVFKNKIKMSVSLFNLIQMRYFPSNDTVLIRKLKL